MKKVGGKPLWHKSNGKGSGGDIPHDTIGILCVYEECIKSFRIPRRELDCMRAIKNPFNLGGDLINEALGVIYDGVDETAMHKATGALTFVAYQLLGLDGLQHKDLVVFDNITKEVNAYTTEEFLNTYEEVK